MFRTHLAFGFLIAMASVFILKPQMPLLFITIIILTAGLPDIDHPKSFYGRRLKIISWPISLIFKHRGFFHSIFPPLIIFFIFKYFNLTYIGVAFVIGYLSHLVADAITKEGINFLHPFSSLSIKGPIKTGAIMESFTFYILVILDIVLIIKMFGF